MVIKISEILKELKAVGIYTSSGEIRRALKMNGKTKIFDEKKRLVWAIDRGELNWLIKIMRPAGSPPEKDQNPDPEKEKDQQPITSDSTQNGGIPWVLVIVALIVIVFLFNQKTGLNGQ